MSNFSGKMIVFITGKQRRMAFISRVTRCLSLQLVLWHNDLHHPLYLSKMSLFGDCIVISLKNNIQKQKGNEERRKEKRGERKALVLALWLSIQIAGVFLWLYPLSHFIHLLIQSFNSYFLSLTVSQPSTATGTNTTSEA